MDEKQLNRALANLTNDNEVWVAIDHLLTESKNHATLVALDVAVKGEDRTWQCGYAQAGEHSPDAGEEAEGVSGLFHWVVIGYTASVC